MGNTKEKLFGEFPGSGKKAWWEAIEKDLPGRDPDRLRWKTYEGLRVEPFYTKEDLSELRYLTDQQPGSFPYTRGSHEERSEWLINQVISAPGVKEANRKALYSIERGAASLTFECRIEGKNIHGVPIKNKNDMSALLKDIPLSDIPVNFVCGEGAEIILSLLLASAGELGFKPDELSGSVDADPVGSLLLGGSNTAGDEGFRLLESAVGYASVNAPGVRVIKVHGEYFDMAGASAAQQVAFTLAAGVEYLNRLTEAGVEADAVSRHLGFVYAVGSGYFPEIAKLRAARTLWSMIMDAYKKGGDSAPCMYMEVETSGWNKTIYDPYVNMLRGTVEAMAGVIGGAHSVSVTPFNATYRTADEFSQRMSGNTQLILKNESYLDKVADPSAGSYYIENLTDLLSSRAWELFLEIDEKGGLLKAAESGFVQNEIEKTRQSRDMDIATRRATFTGVNQYPSAGEKMLDKIKDTEYVTELANSGKAIDRSEPDAFTALLDYIGDGSNIGGLLADNRGGRTNGVTPLQQYRGARAFEELRLAAEAYGRKSGGTPAVFLLPVGNISMRNARAAFSSNFFGCAGFELISGAGYGTASEGIEAALESGSDIVVICSSDAEYPELAPGICRELKGKKPEIKIIVAGNPKNCIDELREAGVDDFIHVRSNALEMLEKYQRYTGITK